MMKALIIFLFSGVLAISAQCPTFVTRDGWAARRATATIPVLGIRPAPMVIVHATGTNSCTIQRECSSIVRSIQAFQMDSNQWADISYHFLVGEDNVVYVGRGWGRRGENVGDFSNQAINVGFIGNFRDRQPADETRGILNRLIQCGISEGHLPSNVQVAAQCQVQPFAACEATTIFDWISGTERFVENPRPV